MNKTRLNEIGQEVLNPKPLAIPLGFQRPPTLQEQVRRLMRYEYNLMKQATGDDIETPEEADDFDVGDDFDIDPVSGHEYIDPEIDPKVMPQETLREEIQKEDKTTSEEIPKEAHSEAPSA